MDKTYFCLSFNFLLNNIFQKFEIITSKVPVCHFLIVFNVILKFGGKFCPYSTQSLIYIPLKPFKYNLIVNEASSVKCGVNFPAFL